MAYKVSNFASTTLASGITADDTTISVVDATVFPALGSGDSFYAVVVNALAQREIVEVTGRSSSVLTVTRGREGTTKRIYAGGSVIELRLTAASITAMEADAAAAGAALAKTYTDAQIPAVAQPMINADCPIGAVFMFMEDFSEVPTNHPGFIPLDGRAISRTTYSVLYALWGERYGVGDGALTFNVFDARGLFPRVQNAGATFNATTNTTKPTADPDAATRLARADGATGDNVGTLQAAAEWNHAHGIIGNYLTIAAGGEGATDYGNAGTSGVPVGWTDTLGQDTAWNGKNSDSEARPSNFYCCLAVRAL